MICIKGVWVFFHHVARMIEFRIHGRGGQGSVAAAYLLAETAFRAGHMCQAFPAFGAERRGAPLTAFVRTDRKPIRLRSQVRTPDYLIVQDDTLLNDASITAGLKPEGAMIVNSTRDADTVMDRFRCRAVCLPANEIAVREIGRPIPNTALLAAFLSLTAMFPLEALGEALRSRFKGDILERNLRLIENASQLVEKNAWRTTSDA